METEQVPRAWNSAQPVTSFTMTNEVQHAGSTVSYQVAADDGTSGSATVVELFPGITLIQFSLKTRVLGEFYEVPNRISLENTVDIVYIKHGSIEFDREDELSSVLQVGEVGIAASDSRWLILRCPVGYVRGVAIIMSRGMRAEARRVLMTFGVDPAQVRSLAHENEKLHVVPSRPELIATFELLSSGHAEASRSLYRLKAVEALQLLTKADPKTPQAPVSEHRRSTRLSHVELAYRAQRIMMGNLQTPVTITTLATRCGTSATVLKEAFRETFGEPIYQWYRTYRIKLAAETLKTTDLTIAEVASSVGYANPSKFTKAFADTMGKTPRAWRAQMQAERPGMMP